MEIDNFYQYVLNVSLLFGKSFEGLYAWKYFYCASNFFLVMNCAFKVLLPSIHSFSIQCGFSDYGMSSLFYDFLSSGNITTCLHIWYFHLIVVHIFALLFLFSMCPLHMTTHVRPLLPDGVVWGIMRRFPEGLPDRGILLIWQWLETVLWM